MSEEGVEWEDVPIDSAPALTDHVLIAKERVLLSKVAELFASSGALAPLAAVDPTTTSQFTAPPLSSGVTGGSLTSVTDDVYPEGKKLSLAATVLAPYAYMVRWLDGTYPLAEVESIEADLIYPEVVSAGSEVVAGLAFCGDASATVFIAIGIGVDSAGGPVVRGSRADTTPPGGANIMSSTDAGVGGRMKISIRGTRPVAAIPPQLIFEVEIRDFAGNLFTRSFTTSYIEYLGAWTPEWETATCSKVGLFLGTGSTGAADPVAASFSGVRVNRRAA